jgi:hypothetical protein
VTQLRLTTPWARRYVSDDDRAQIAVIAPAGSVVTLGCITSPSDWYCAVELDGRKIEDRHARTGMSAFLRCLAALEEMADARS